MRVFTTAFLLCAALLANAQPANDQCSAVTPVALPIGSTLNLTGTRSGATTANDGVPTSILMTTPNAATVWEAFTTTECSNVTALFCGTSLPATTMWNFITTTCPADVPIYFSYANFGYFCINGQFGISWHNLPPGTYYLPIYCAPSGGAYSLELNAVACIPGPENDACAGAVPLPVNLECEPTESSVLNATLSFPANECNGTTGDANDDVWFSFVATGTAHTITMNNTEGTVDGVIELFDGTCGSLGTPLACADETLDSEMEVLEATGLTPGTTYYIRVFDWYTALPIEPYIYMCVTGDLPSGVHTDHGTHIMISTLPQVGLFQVTGMRAGGVMRCTDATGRLVMQGRITNTAELVDLSGEGVGMYALEVIDPSGSVQRIKLLR